MVIAVNLSAEPIDATAEYARFVSGAATSGAGAIVAMTGHVRGVAADGRTVQAMELQTYREATLASIEHIVADAAVRFDLVAGGVHHRFGVMTPGETVVFIIVAAQHRRAAFDAVDYLMDRLKSEAVFWKRETDSAGRAQWIEPTKDDTVALDRWRSLGK